MPELPESQNDQDATFSGGQTAAELAEEAHKQQEMDAAWAERTTEEEPDEPNFEDSMHKLADWLTDNGANLPPEELAQIKSGLAARGLLTDNPDEESLAGAMTHAVLTAEEKMAEAHPTEASPAEPESAITETAKQAEAQAAMDRLEHVYGVTNEAAPKNDEEPAYSVKDNRTWERNPQSDPQPAVEKPPLTKGERRLEQQRMKRIIDADDMSENQRIWDRTVYLDNTDPDVVERARARSGVSQAKAETAVADPNPLKTFLDTTRARGGRKLDGPQPPAPDAAPTPSSSPGSPDNLRQSAIDQDRRQFEANNAETRGPKTDKMHEDAIIENFEHNIRNSMRSEKSGGVLERLQRLSEMRNERKAQKAERERVAELQREYQERGETRGPLTGEDVEAAYAANLGNSLAAGEAKNGRIEHARDLLEAAHAKSEEARQHYREAKDAVPGQVDEIKKDILLMFDNPNRAPGETSVYQEVKLGDSDEINVQLLHELRQRIGASNEPAMTRRFQPRQVEPFTGELPEGADPSEAINERDVMPVTELIYTTNVDPRLVYSEHWTEDGQLVSARLVTTEKPAFKERRVTRLVKRATGSRSLNALRPTDEALTALNTVSEADNVPEPLDFSETRALTSVSDRLKRNYKPVTQRLENIGVDEATAGYITGRKKAKGRVRRRGVWSTLRGN